MPQLSLGRATTAAPLCGRQMNAMEREGGRSSALWLSRTSVSVEPSFFTGTRSRSSSFVNSSSIKHGAPISAANIPPPFFRPAQPFLLQPSLPVPLRAATHRHELGRDADSLQSADKRTHSFSFSLQNTIYRGRWRRGGWAVGGRALDSTGEPRSRALEQRPPPLPVVERRPPPAPPLPRPPPPPVQLLGIDLDLARSTFRENVSSSSTRSDFVFADSQRACSSPHALDERAQSVILARMQQINTRNILLKKSASTFLQMTIANHWTMDFPGLPRSRRIQ